MNNTRKRKFLYLLAILLGGAFFRLIFYTGPYSNDDFKYSQHAYELLKFKETYKGDLALYHEYLKTKHKFFIPSTKYYFPLYVPVALLYKLFGVNNWTTFLWPFLCSLGNIMLVFFLAELIFPHKKTGLLAAGLISFFPLSTIFATRLLPDEISNFFAALTILFFLKSYNRKYWGYLSGLMLGITYMTRCYFLVLFLPFFIYAFWKKRLRDMFIPMALGFSAVFVLDNIFFLWLHFKSGGPFIFRLKVEQELTVYLNKTMAPQTNLVLIQKFPRPFFDFNIMGLYYYFLIPIFLYLIFTKKIKEIMIPLICFFYCLLSLWFLPISWRPLTLINRDTRYLDILTMPAILIMAFFISGMRESHRYLGRGVVILLLVSSFYSMTNQIYGPDTEKFGAESFKMAADILKVISPKAVYCDNPSVSTKINYYFKFDPPFRLERSVKLTPEVSNVYVLIHDFRENPPLDKEGIIRSIKSGEILGGRTAHLQGDEFDLSKWILLKIIKGRKGPYIYLFYLSPLTHA